MRRIVFISLLLFMTAFGLVAQVDAALDLYGGFRPVDPEVLGRGNGIIANSQGLRSFYYNPAGFGLTDNFTLVDAKAWIFSDQATIALLQQLSNDGVDPTAGGMEGIVDTEALITYAQENPQEVDQLVADLRADGYDVPLREGLTDEQFAQAFINYVSGLETEQQQIDFITTVSEQEGVREALNLPSGNMSVGAHVGGGFIIDGFGFALDVITEAAMTGDSIFSATGFGVATTQLHLGYAYLFDLDRIKLSVGGQLRPFFRSAIPGIAVNDLLGVNVDVQSVLGYQDSKVGWGIAMDAGAILEVDLDILKINAGIAARDLFDTWIYYSPTTVSDLMNGVVPELTLNHNYSVPMTLGAGVSVDADLEILTLSGFLDVIDVIEFFDSRRVITPDPIRLLNVGVEAEFLEMIAARVGYSQGYWTLGAGLNLFVFEINAAVILDGYNPITEIRDFEKVTDFGATIDFKMSW